MAALTDAWLDGTVYTVRAAGANVRNGLSASSAGRTAPRIPEAGPEEIRTFRWGYFAVL
jgi:hypothetical protein